ncbi:MAG TPA: hypothetical protein VGC13_23860 [Longimicrobium sp.]|jgi:hypothetical protein|uniref:hypothetical protein n=1 Tax=Longimicrobium sp. TaxID=2029185 RepID=UPI002EDAE38E
MRDWLASPWVNIVGAIAGGMALGYGLGSLPGGITVVGIVWTVIGLLLLWWTLVDRARASRRGPGSERDGSHTIE